MSWVDRLRRLVRTRSTGPPPVTWTVRFDADAIRFEGPGGSERLAWTDLRGVDLATTADGPWFCDVFLVLHGPEGQGGLVVPQEADGFDALLERLGLLPGFDFAAVIAAMGCTDEARFPCWSRPGGED